MQKFSILFTLVLGLQNLAFGDELKPVNSNSPEPDFATLTVLNSNGETPKKGEDLEVRVKVKNFSEKNAIYKVLPVLSSLRFTDYSNISLVAQSVELKAGEEKELCFQIQHFFENSKNQKKYALGRGEYQIALTIEDEAGTLVQSSKHKFEIEKSNAVNVLVIYDPKYFAIGENRVGRDAVDWVRESQTRSASLFDANSGRVQTYAGGFQELLGFKALYQAYGNAKFVETSGDVMPYFATAEAAAKEALGLERNWISICQGTCKEHHGFDYMIALNPIFMGGVALSSGQVSGGFSYDQSQGRSQMVITHESGHVYGAPHCDPIQGFIMCSGEKAESYKESGDFLWHGDSLKAMNAKKFE